MKNKVIKLFFFLVIGLLLMMPINNAYVKTNGYRHLNDTDKFMNVPYDLDLINLGSSHGLNGFNYEETGVKAYNMALAAQGFYYDYRILTQYSDHLSDGAVVLLPISYFSPYQAYQGEKFDQFNMRYYRFMDPKNIKFFNPIEYIRYKQFPVMFAGEHIKYLFADRETLKADWEMVDYNKFGETGIIEEGKTRAEHHMKNIIEIGKDNKETALSELRNTIDFCYEKGYKPVLVTTPLHYEYKKHFSETFMNEFLSDIESLRDDYSILYLDYSDFMSTETDIFMDSDHLNSKGRKMFTNAIVEDLKQRDILNNINAN